MSDVEKLDEIVKSIHNIDKTQIPYKLNSTTVGQRQYKNTFRFAQNRR